MGHSVSMQDERHARIFIFLYSEGMSLMVHVCMLVSMGNVAGAVCTFVSICKGEARSQGGSACCFLQHAGVSYVFL